MSFNINVAEILRERQQANSAPIKDPYTEFLDTLIAYGFDISTVEASGKIVRCDATDSKRGSKPCWYSFEVDGHGVGWGSYGDWRLGEKEKFRSGNFSQLDPEQRRRCEENARMQAELAHQRQLKLYADNAEKAKLTLSRLTECDRNFEHPYLASKNVPALGGIKTDGEHLFLPVSVSGEISSYQRITGPGKKNKFFLRDARLDSGYFFIPGRTSKVYFVEGYATGATIHKATGANVVVCFFASNLYQVLKAYRQQYQEPIVIAADNDHVTESEGKRNAGIYWADKCSKEFSNVTYVYPTDIEGSDFNDLEAEKGIDAVRATLGHKKNRLEIVQVDEMPVSSNKWFIKRFMPQKKVGVIFGQSGHMKSFVAIDIAMHLATGKEWHGHLVKEQHDILYVCGEGADGIRNRVVAWKKHYGIAKPTPFYMTTSPVLFLEKDHVSLMIESLQDFMVDRGVAKYPSIIIIDTLNRNFGGGDENSTQDMTKFIAALDEISSLTGSMFIIVHHSSKADSKKARGNASLYNASDFEYRVEMINQDAVRELGEEPKIMVECTKMKDSSEPKPKMFTPTVIPLHVDEDGDQITSLVLEQSNVQARTPAEQTAVEAKSFLRQPLAAANSDSDKAKVILRDAIVSAGRELIKRHNQKLGVCPFIADEAVRQIYRERCSRAGINDNTSRAMKKRGLESMVRLGLLTVQGGENPGVIINHGDFLTLINEVSNG